MVLELNLSKGKKAIIDSEDFDKVNQYKWYCNNYGYAVRTKRINGKQTMFWLHRYILDCDKGFEVDHINGNPLDNRKENLRICSRKQNCRNVKMPITNTSGLKGVSFDKRRKKYRAYISNNNKQIFLGYFSNKIEAAKAYNNKAILLFGEYSKLNVFED